MGEFFGTVQSEIMSSAAAPHAAQPRPASSALAGLPLVKFIMTLTNFYKINEERTMAKNENIGDCKSLDILPTTSPVTYVTYDQWCKMPN